MNKLTQKGFTLVEGLLIVVAVLLLGFGGYYVYSQNNKEDETVVQEVIETSEITAEEVDSDIFEISELGLYLSKEVVGYDDLAYEVLSEETESESVRIGIYSEDLRSKLQEAGQNGCNETVSIFYYDVTGGMLGESDIQYNGREVYVGYEGPCGAADENLQGEMTNFRDGVKRAVGLAVDSPIDAIEATRSYCSEAEHTCLITVVDDAGDYVVTSGGEYRYLVVKDPSGNWSVVIASEEENICDTGTGQPDLVKYCSS